MSIIKSFSVGDGDTYYIKHGSSNFTVIDCNLDERRDEIIDEIADESVDKDIFRFISTHPDEDHIHGLEFLDDRKGILNFYCVQNRATKDVQSPSFQRYCELRDSTKAYYLYKDCHRCWMNENDEEMNYGSSGINILWPVTTNTYFQDELNQAAEGKSPNNISPIISYSLTDGVRALRMGDLESTFMSKIEDEVELTHIDILFAPHHGRQSGRPPQSWMDAMNPRLVVVGEANSDVLDYYQGYTHICQNSAGDMVFNCTDGRVDVYVDNIYCGLQLPSRLNLGDSYGLHYAGSFETWD